MPKFGAGEMRSSLELIIRYIGQRCCDPNGHIIELCCGTEWYEAPQGGTALFLPVER